MRISFIRNIENAVYGGVRDPSAQNVTDQPQQPWDTESLKNHKYVLLTTYRRNGTPVNTPVWFGPQGDRIYIRSGAADGKVKRIRHTPRVLITPCGARGAPIGETMQATARILEPRDYGPAEAALRTHYGFGRRLYRLIRRRIDVAYIEIAGPER
jgi:uncharacterized protein